MLNALAKLTFILVLVCSFLGEGSGSAQAQEDAPIKFNEPFQGFIAGCLTLTAAMGAIHADMEGTLDTYWKQQEEAGMCGMVKTTARAIRLVGEYTSQTIRPGVKVYLIEFEILTPRGVLKFYGATTSMPEPEGNPA